MPEVREPPRPSRTSELTSATVDLEVDRRAGARLADVRLVEDLLADDFLAGARLADVRLVEVLLADDFFAGARLADDFLAGAFFADDFFVDRDLGGLA